VIVPVAEWRHGIHYPVTRPLAWGARFSPTTNVVNSVSFVVGTRFGLGAMNRAVGASGVGIGDSGCS
jgi:hypothetical protein